MVEDVDGILNEFTADVELGISGLVRSAVAKEIWGNNSISHGFEEGNLLGPEVGGSRETMLEESGLALDGGRKVIRVVEPPRGLELFEAILVHCGL